ncbi:hypothetical protein B0F88_10515 [Methylobacter tundripaludum]|uniref:Uncharacterized protein n=1 Tax=Methylobacter tundripaludum TaxID=173365 RepID=A0A2S6H375_9GAMM|nr:hypothetical protein B0F88_10515 [Methylobacter tundripaludum]
MFVLLLRPPLLVFLWVLRVLLKSNLFGAGLLLMIRFFKLL